MFFLNIIFIYVLDFAEINLGFKIGDFFEKGLGFLIFIKILSDFWLGCIPFGLCVGPLWHFNHVLRHFYMCSCIVHSCSVVLHAKYLTKCSSGILCCIGLKWVPLLGFTLDWTCLTCFGQWVCVLHTLPNLCLNAMPCTIYAHTRHPLGTHHASPHAYIYTAHAQHMHTHAHLLFSCILLMFTLFSTFSMLF